MKELIQQFEEKLKRHLENTFSASPGTDNIKRLSETEKTVYDFVDNYILESDFIAADLEPSVQYILDEFAKSKINYIE
ncbi:hypothetical protein NJT12_15940 [Flavobacterium sp. AC]|uniref:Uncharacterized protein n=1 Tax=Flavobacterium azizsancarii TaxID=2961580 RepID=A0ABT4WEX0_9FLAO|nr:hypothetical protein [Flavobacterium azizsancarii]MDA6071107.1 hypothetical protein [Flavobacterium azizsancarii]